MVVGVSGSVSTVPSFALLHPSLDTAQPSAGQCGFIQCALGWCKFTLAVDRYFVLGKFEAGAG